MTNLIDYNYFKGSLQIANAQETSYVQTALTAFITEKQKDFLLELLDYELYDLFDAWVTTPGNTPAPLAAMFTLLRDGVWKGKGSAGENIFWAGLKQPLAEYVYYWYMRNNASQTVSSGEAKGVSQNSVVADMRPKMTYAWNSMRNKMYAYLNFMRNNFSTYEGVWNEFFWYGNNWNIWNSWRYQTKNIFYPINDMNI